MSAIDYNFRPRREREPQQQWSDFQRQQQANRAPRCSWADCEKRATHRGGLCREHANERKNEYQREYYARRKAELEAIRARRIARHEAHKAAQQAEPIRYELPPDSELAQAMVRFPLVSPRQALLAHRRNPRKVGGDE